MNTFDKFNIGLHMDLTEDDNIYKTSGYLVIKEETFPFLVKIVEIIELILIKTLETHYFTFWLLRQTESKGRNDVNLICLITVKTFTVNTLLPKDLSQSEQMVFEYEVSFEHNFYQRKYELTNDAKDNLMKYHSSVNPFKYYKVVEVSFEYL